ncbi:MAG: ATP-dependent DNA helicase, partial [Candidatus Hodarchaeota archaeon]
MKIDQSKQEIQVSVRELAFGFIPNRGYSPIPTRVRRVMGQKAHQNLQKEMMERIESKKREEKILLEEKKGYKPFHQKETTYEAEKHVKFTTEVDDWTVIITGRIDGYYEEGDVVVIEEIKSVMDLSNFDMNALPAKAYLIQLQIYGYIFVQQGKKVRCQLVLVELLSENTKRIGIPLEDHTSLIQLRIKEILEHWKAEQQLKSNQRTRFSTIKFPFSKYRPEQDKIIKQAEETIENGKRLMISAPSGLGKTVGTLFPTIKVGLTKNLRVFVVTSKTTQQRIYKDTLRRMVKKGSNLQAIILTAKEKLCLNSEYICDPQVCSLLENYNTQDFTEAIEDLLTRKVIEAKDVKKKAEEVGTCPFELSLDTSLFCDVIVGDYNYVFHPTVFLRRFFEKPYNDSILIIDESHNLPSRATDYYSPEIALRRIWEVENHLRSLYDSEEFTKKGLEPLQDLYLYIQGLSTHTKVFNKRKCGIVSLDEKKITKIQKKIDEFVFEFVREFNREFGQSPTSKDPMLSFAAELRWFQTVLIESNSNEFSYIYDADVGVLKILCKCAAPKLAQRIKGFHAVIAQSATLSPFKYFRQMLGFPKDTQMREYPSPFPSENRLYLTYPYISTKYKERDIFYRQIGQIIRDCITIRKGNYLAFFPSFNYLKEVLKKMEEDQFPIKLLIQEREMSERKRRKFLRRLKQSNEKYLLLGVHGGIFSEGVDYPGEMADGIFIIGPGLPTFYFEQELINNYFQDTYGKGFEYAYRNVGMNRVVQ